MAKICTKRNSIGECIEMVEVGDTFILKFKDAEKECNKDLYEKWKQMIAEGKVKALD